MTERCPECKSTDIIHEGGGAYICNSCLATFALTPVAGGNAADPFRLRVAASIGGPPWWRPRMSREPGVFLIGWLWISLYVEWRHDGA